MKELIKTFKAIFETHKDFKYQFSVEIWQTDFLRFFQSMTNYNISKKNVKLDGTVYKGKKSFNFEISDPTEDKLKEKLNFIENLIDNLPEDPDFVDLEKDTSTKELPLIKNNIKEIGLENKIDILSQLSKAVEKYNHKIYGTFITNFVEYFIVNSNGIDKYYKLSPIMLDVKSMNQKNMVTVIESFGGVDFSKFNLEKFKSNLVQKVELSNLDIIDLEPGEYQTILSPSAIGEFISYLMHTLNGRSLDTKESYFIDKIDKKVFPDFISISDEPTNEDTIPYYYNQDGKTLENLKIIEKGVFKNFLIDNYYANKLKMEENGNMGTNLVLHAGMDSVSDMIKNVDRGLYVSKLHYMNFINPRETTVTGLTRDGTFYIENGQIKNVVVNLRYTENIVEILKNTFMIENYLSSVPSSTNYGNFHVFTQLMPHIMTQKFHITSSTHTL